MVADTLESLWQQAKEAIERQEWDVARPLLLQALGMKSDSPDLHYNLATVCFQLEDLPNAAYHFKEVTRLDPLRAGAYINLGAIYNLLDQLDDATTVLRRGLQLDPHRSDETFDAERQGRGRLNRSRRHHAGLHARLFGTRRQGLHRLLARLHLGEGGIAVGGMQFSECRRLDGLECKFVFGGAGFGIQAKRRGIARGVRRSVRGQ